MMTTRKQTERTQVETRTTTLSPLEEKVVRMRRGLRAPDSLVLERVGQGHPEAAKAIAEIEERALASVAARNNPTKRKIISALRRKPN